MKIPYIAKSIKPEFQVTRHFTGLRTWLIILLSAFVNTKEMMSTYRIDSCNLS